jgi:hypothetical protein
MKNSIKIIALWGITLAGLAFHSLIEITPLFFGASVVIPDATGTMPASMGWMSLILYLIPMICIVGVLYLSSAWTKITNLVISAFFLLLNAVHFVEDGIIGHNMIQAILLLFVLFSSVLLFVASWKWEKE